MKPLEYFRYLLEELPQADKTEEEVLKRYLPYTDTLPDTCHASDSESDMKAKVKQPYQLIQSTDTIAFFMSLYVCIV